MIGERFEAGKHRMGMRQYEKTRLTYVLGLLFGALEITASGAGVRTGSHD